MNVSFKNVKAMEYVTELLNSAANVIYAEKSGCVFARKAADPKGEYITVYTSNGTEEVHKEYAAPGAWILTRANIHGEIVLNDKGQPNSWVPQAGVFEKKYDTANMRADGFTKPQGGMQKFIKITENITIMVPWGKDGALIPQHLEAGAVLNVTKLDDIYGIAEIEFGETYAVIDL